MTDSDAPRPTPAAALAEIRRRVDLALTSDDGEPFSADIGALAERVATGDACREVQIALGAIIEADGRPVRDMIEACSLLAFARREHEWLPVSAARAMARKLNALNSTT